MQRLLLVFRVLKTIKTYTKFMYGWSLNVFALHINYDILVYINKHLWFSNISMRTNAYKVKLNSYVFFLYVLLGNTFFKHKNFIKQFNDSESILINETNILINK